MIGVTMSADKLDQDPDWLSAVLATSETIGPKSILLISQSDRFEMLKQALDKANYTLNGCYFLDQPKGDLDQGQLSPTNLIEFALRATIDEVLIYLPEEEADVTSWIESFESMGMTVHVAIPGYTYPDGLKREASIAGIPVTTYAPTYHKTSHLIFKRLIDIAGALVGLLICGFVGVILYPLIRRDGGPAIFAQDRVGRNGRIFKFYKYRSMYMDAEERKKELMAENIMEGGMFKMDNDPRITPIGKFIRKTSLDELPQFYNVLRGDMSLVGTRPPTKQEFLDYTPAQKRRLSFKPGITGLWQVSGRSEITKFEDVVALDVEYIQDWTIMDDIKILLKTIKVVAFGDGAK
ncbi:sugar transferase [Streptococcus sp. NLN76]|uniref:exopolysaccharide biosynthesis polyprenyl glycosylphosphotransferase n=1 Tax=Streptococcus sp. NLN76 TaxID=2822800 RepID=UPI0018AC3209|nr:sugar transferase [Streptococcus sp. NLN76]